MKHRLVSILAFSLVASLLAAACTTTGGRRRNNNTIKLDGSSPDNNNNNGGGGGNEDPVDLKKPSSTPSPDLSKPSTNTGDLSCQGYFGCAEGCSQTDDACFEDCWNDTSTTGQDQFGDIFNCLASYCIDQGDCELDGSGTQLADTPTCTPCLQSDPAGSACESTFAACE